MRRPAPVCLRWLRSDRSHNSDHRPANPPLAYEANAARPDPLHIDVQKSFFLNIKIEEIKGKE
jgi:hypothetical protein